MTWLARIRACRAGAVAIEFALVAPLFFAFLFGVIEASRVFWIKQSLDEVAYSTARCMSVSKGCASAASQKQHAVTRAGKLGITLVASQIVPSAGVTCKGAAGSNSVAITRPISSPLAGFVPAMPSRLRATACFPVLS